MSEVSNGFINEVLAFAEFYKAEPAPDEAFDRRQAHVGTSVLASVQNEGVAPVDEASDTLVSEAVVPCEPNDNEAENVAVVDDFLQKEGLAGADKPTVLKPIESWRDTGAETPDTIDVFLKRASQYKLLRPHEELRLAEGIEKGNLADKELLINSNLRLVVSIARRYQGLGLHMSDLMQEGCIGLMRAAEKFDYRKGFRFSTYATLWIRQALQRGLDNTGREIRFPANVAQAHRKVRIAEMNFTAANEREPSQAELAAEADIKQFELEQLQQMPHIGAHLDAPVSSGDGSSSLGDILAIDVREAGFEEVERDEAAQAIRDALQHPAIINTPNALEILTLRYGLDGNTALSVREIAHELNLSSAEIERTENRALDILSAMEDLREKTRNI